MIDVGEDTNGDSLISFSETEAASNLWLERQGITDVIGIEAFVMLDTFACAINNIETLDLSALSNLNLLWCNMNPIDSLNLNPGLLLLAIEGCNLTSLDLSNNPLLNWLSCEGNQLTVLDVSNNPELNLLWCGDNLLQKLDLNNNTKLGGVPSQYGHLNVDNMPSLTEVCVWDGFSGDAEISFEGSPNVCFDSISCNGVCNPGVDIEEFDDFELMIYPNPTSDILTIQTAGFGPHSIQLHTLNGQEIYAATFTGNFFELDLSPYRKGIHFLHIRPESLTAIRKIVKL